jgi:RNA polymerase primary sigma factor
LYFNEISKIPLLTADEEKELAYAIRYGENEDWARKKLIASNLRLVISIAKKFLGSRLGFLDLIQE